MPKKRGIPPRWLPASSFVRSPAPWDRRRGKNLSLKTPASAHPYLFPKPLMVMTRGPA